MAPITIICLSNWNRSLNEFISNLVASDFNRPWPQGGKRFGIQVCYKQFLNMIQREEEDLFLKICEDSLSNPISFNPIGQLNTIREEFQFSKVGISQPSLSRSSSHTQQKIEHEFGGRNLCEKNSKWTKQQEKKFYKSLAKVLFLNPQFLEDWEQPLHKNIFTVMSAELGSKDRTQCKLKYLSLKRQFHTLQINLSPKQLIIKKIATMKNDKEAAELTSYIRNEGDCMNLLVRALDIQEEQLALAKEGKKLDQLMKECGLVDKINVPIKKKCQKKKKCKKN